jgi:hypothetical protein
MKYPRQLIYTGKSFILFHNSWCHSPKLDSPIVSGLSGGQYHGRSK